MTRPVLLGLVALLATVTLVTADQLSDFTWVYTYPTGFSCDPLSIKALGADPKGEKDVSAVLTSASSVANFEASGILHVTAGTYLVAKSVSVSKPLSMANGAVFKIAAGVTLTLNAPIVPASSTSQIFSGPGKVAFGFGVQASVHVDWFGAKGNGVTDDTAAIKAAVVASESNLNVIFSAKTYLISSAITVGPNTVIQGVSGSVVKGKSSSIDGFIFSLPKSGGVFLGRQALPALQNFRRAITFSDAGIVDVFSPSVIDCEEAVRVQSLRAKGAGRQISQVRVSIPTVTNVVKVVNFFDLNGKAVMQGSNFIFGTYTDTGRGKALVFFQTSGGGTAFWDSNDYQFKTVIPSTSSSSTLTLLGTDSGTTLYRQQLYIDSLRAMPAKGRVTNANVQDCIFSIGTAKTLTATQMELPAFTSAKTSSSNFNNFEIRGPVVTGLVAATASNSRKSFNRGELLSNSLFTLAIRNNVPSEDPRTGKTPPNGPTWPAGESRRFYIYHALAQRGQLVFVTVPKAGSQCLPSGVAITNIFDRSAKVPYELEVVAVACKDLKVSAIKTGAIDISFQVLVGTVGLE